MVLCKLCHAPRSLHTSFGYCASGAVGNTFVAGPATVCPVVSSGPAMDTICAACGIAYGKHSFDRAACPIPGQPNSGVFVPPTLTSASVPLSRECKCGIYRQDCDYHRDAVVKDAVSEYIEFRFVCVGEKFILMPVGQYASPYPGGVCKKVSNSGRIYVNDVNSSGDYLTRPEDLVKIVG